jgi:hypothetical protein
VRFPRLLAKPDYVQYIRGALCARKLAHAEKADAFSVLFIRDFPYRKTQAKSQGEFVGSNLTDARTSPLVETGEGRAQSEVSAQECPWYQFGIDL